VNITMLLELAVDAFGDRPVLTAGGMTLTPERLAELARAGAAELQAGGFDAVVFLGTFGPAFAVATFAAAYAGIPVVPINYRLGDEQRTELVGRHPGAVVLDGDGCEAWLAGLATKTGDVDALKVADDPELPAVLLYTSGTTSAPKAVILRHRHLTSYVLTTVEMMSADEGDAALISVPPYHIAGIANLLTNLFAGRRAIVLDTFAPDQWVRLVNEEGVTHALVVPTMLARLVEHAGNEPIAVPSLRSLAYGGARTPAAVLERALRVFPTVDFVHAYGLTETSSTIAVLGPDDHRAALDSNDPAVRARLASVGQVIPGVECEVRDADGVALPAGMPGRVWLRGEQVSGEYMSGESALDDAGWFDTRDRGWLDNDGYLFIEGRDDDTIIRGAENIAPAEIETVLLRHPDVADAVVIGVPDDEWGQRLAAVITPQPGGTVDAAAVRQWAREQLRASKTPEWIVVWDELPRTDNGKIIRREVVARYCAAAGTDDEGATT